MSDKGKMSLLRDYLKEKISKHIEYKKNPMKLLDDLYFDEIGGLVKFNPYPIQKYVVQTFLKKHFVIINKSRQTGISTIFSIVCALLLILYPNYSIGVISKEKDAACDFVNNIKNTLLRLPENIRPRKFVENNKKSLILTNGSFVKADCVSLSNPDKTLRSKAIALLIIDEAAFIPKIDIAFAGIFPTLSKTQQVCRKRNIPYGIVIISTPNGMVGKGKWFFDMWTSANGSQDVQIDLNEDDPILPYIPIEVKWQMIPSYDDAWYRKQCASITDPRLIAQEFDLKFLGDKDCVFDDEIIEIIQDNTTKENRVINEIPVVVALDKDVLVDEEIYNHCRLKLFEEIDEKKRYFLGCDVATKFGECFSCIQIIDSETGIQVGEFSYKLKVKHLYYALVRLMDIFPNNITVFENSGVGNQLIEEFEEDNIKFNFNNKYIDRLYKTFDKDKSTGKFKKTYKLGFTTTVTSRTQVMNNFYSLVEENPYMIRSSSLGFQTIQLRNKNGKLVKGNGKFDDSVLAMAFALHLFSNPNVMVDLNSLHKDFKENEIENMTNITRMITESDTNIMIGMGKNPQLDEINDLLKILK
ncbi:MAG: hypothetical protein WDA59_06880 [Methanofastidiosum sp.]